MTGRHTAAPLADAADNDLQVGDVSARLDTTGMDVVSRCCRLVGCSIIDRRDRRTLEWLRPGGRYTMTPDDEGWRVTGPGLTDGEYWLQPREPARIDLPLEAGGRVALQTGTYYLEPAGADQWRVRRLT